MFEDWTDAESTSSIWPTQSLGQKQTDANEGAMEGSPVARAKQGVREVTNTRIKESIRVLETLAINSGGNFRNEITELYPQ